MRSKKKAIAKANGNPPYMERLKHVHGHMIASCRFGLVIEKEDRIMTGNEKSHAREFPKACVRGKETEEEMMERVRS